MPTFGLIDPSLLTRSLEKHQRRTVRVRPVRRVYVNFLCAGAEEIDDFLISELDEDLRRCFLTVAYQLSRVLARLREKKFQEIMADINDAIREEVRHDGCAVGNMVCVADAIERGKELVFYLAEGIDQRIQSARDQMVSMGFCEFSKGNADAIFRNLVPFNPDAL